MIFLRNIINDLENRIFFFFKSAEQSTLNLMKPNLSFYTKIIQNQNGLLQKASTLFLITPKLRFVEISQASFCLLYTLLLGTH